MLDVRARQALRVVRLDVEDLYNAAVSKERLYQLLSSILTMGTISISSQRRVHKLGAFYNMR